MGFRASWEKDFAVKAVCNKRLHQSSHMSTIADTGIISIQEI